MVEEGVISQTFIHHVKSFLVITDGANHSFNVTAIHPIYTNNGWKAAGNLHVGDKITNLVNNHLKYVSIVSIRSVSLDSPIKVYNLEVNGNHNYFANDILVHNKPGAYAIRGIATASGGGSLKFTYGGYFSASGGDYNYGLIVSQGNVGIGTIVPASEFVVGTGGVAIGSNSSYTHDNTVAADSLMVKGNIGIGTWQANNSLIIGSGNVGIGSLVPGQALDVQGTVRATAFVGNGAELTGLSTGLWATQNTTDQSLAGGNVGIGTTLTTTSAMTVMNGNVGIGTWVPATTLNVKGAITSDVVTLTDGATINTDASKGNYFRVTLGGNRTLAAPTNGVDGQRIVYEFIQDGTGSRTLDTSAFAFGADITSVTLSTTTGKHDFMTVIYNTSTNKWYVVAFVKGY